MKARCWDHLGCGCVAACVCNGVTTPKAKLKLPDKNGLLKVRGLKLSSTKTTSGWKDHSKASLLRNGLQVKELL